MLEGQEEFWQIVYSPSKSMLITAAAVVLWGCAEERSSVAQESDVAQASQASKSTPPVPLKLRPDSTPLYPKLKEAFLLTQSRKLDEGAAGYRAVLESAIASNDQPAQALAHEGLGSIFLRKADYPAAKNESEQALSLYRLLQDPVSEAQVNNLLGSVAYAVGDRPLAREYYHKALTSFDSWNMLREKAVLLRDLQMAGEADGEKLLEQSLAAARQVGDKTLEADALHNLGDQLFEKGEFDGAQDRYDQAAKRFQETGNDLSLARVLTSEGRLQRVHGHPEKALLLYQEALKLQEKVGDRLGTVQSINAMAVSYGALNEPAKSAEFYQQALTMAEKTGSPHLINFERSRLASAYIELGRYQEGAELLEALAPKDADYADFDYLNLGEAYSRLGRFQLAAETESKAIAIAQAAKNWQVLPGAFLVRAGDEDKLGKRVEALADAQEALHVIEGVRAHLVANDFMKRGFSETGQLAYSECVRLLEQAGQSGHALEVAEEARARAFLDLLATRDLQLKAASQEQLASLRKGQGESPGEAGKANDEPGSPDGILMRGGRADTARANRPPDPELRSLVSVQPFSLPDVQSTASRLNSTMVSYWVAPEATYIWVVAANGAVHTSIVEVSEKRLEELVSSLAPGAAANHPGESDASARGKVGTRGGTIVSVGASHRKAWRELYSLLIEPVASWLPSKPGSLLTIEPHGPLLMLPFAALTDKQGRYLLERFSLHYTPAVSLLQFTEKKKQKAAQIQPHYLLVADPTDMPRATAESALPSLPGSRREVAAVARLLPQGEITLLEGKQATEDRVEKAAGESTVVHLATHGIIRDDQPFESFLALGGNRSDAKLDGRLTAQKIYGLDLHADLVFLSACRSGAGKVSHDGLVGLTRAFWYAGTPSVIASLWDVADEPTYRLVASFYRSRLQGSDNSRALRSAQLHLLQQLRAGRVSVHTGTNQVTLPEDPMFWASFVLQGEP
jgi:CHAT domain-containing protein/tetratricopeptide (TPR) repeat protein